MQNGAKEGLSSQLSPPSMNVQPPTPNNVAMSVPSGAVPMTPPSAIPPLPVPSSSSSSSSQLPEGRPGSAGSGKFGQGRGGGQKQFMGSADLYASCPVPLNPPPTWAAAGDERSNTSTASSISSGVFQQGGFSGRGVPSVKPHLSHLHHAYPSVSLMQGAGRGRGGMAPMPHHHHHHHHHPPHAFQGQMASNPFGRGAALTAAPVATSSPFRPDIRVAVPTAASSKPDLSSLWNEVQDLKRAMHGMSLRGSSSSHPKAGKQFDSPASHSSATSSHDSREDEELPHAQSLGSGSPKPSTTAGPSLWPRYSSKPQSHHLSAPHAYPGTPPVVGHGMFAHAAGYGVPYPESLYPPSFYPGTPPPSWAGFGHHQGGHAMPPPPPPGWHLYPPYPYYLHPPPPPFGYSPPYGGSQPFHGTPTSFPAVPHFTSSSTVTKPPGLGSVHSKKPSTAMYSPVFGAMLMPEKKQSESPFGESKPPNPFLQISSPTAPPPKFVVGGSPTISSTSTAPKPYASPSAFSLGKDSHGGGEEIAVGKSGQKRQEPEWDALASAPTDIDALRNTMQKLKKSNSGKIHSKTSKGLSRNQGTVSSSATTSTSSSSQALPCACLKMDRVDCLVCKSTIDEYMILPACESEHPYCVQCFRKVFPDLVGHGDFTKWTSATVKCLFCTKSSTIPPSTSFRVLTRFAHVHRIPEPPSDASTGEQPSVHLPDMCWLHKKPLSMFSNVANVMLCEDCAASLPSKYRPLPIASAVGAAASKLFSTWSRLELFGKRAESLKSSWKEQLQRLESQPSEAEMDSVVRNILDGVRAKCQEIIDGSKEERENAQQQAKSEVSLLDNGLEAHAQVLADMRAAVSHLPQQIRAAATASLQPQPSQLSASAPSMLEFLKAMEAHFGRLNDVGRQLSHVHRPPPVLASALEHLLDFADEIQAVLSETGKLSKGNVYEVDSDAETPTPSDDGGQWSVMTPIGPTAARSPFGGPFSQAAMQPTSSLLPPFSHAMRGTPTLDVSKQLRQMKDDPQYGFADLLSLSSAAASFVPGSASLDVPDGSDRSPRLVTRSPSRSREASPSPAPRRTSSVASSSGNTSPVRTPRTPTRYDGRSPRTRSHSPRSPNRHQGSSAHTHRFPSPSPPSTPSAPSVSSEMVALVVKEQQDMVDAMAQSLNQSLSSPSSEQQ